MRMARTQIIPLKNIPNQKLAVVLAGQNCVLHIYQRKQSLFLDITCNNTVIRTGLLCGVNRDIIGSEHTGFSGMLFFSDISGANQSPSYEQLGIRFLFCYAEE